MIFVHDIRLALDGFFVQAFQQFQKKSPDNPFARPYPAVMDDLLQRFNWRMVMLCLSCISRSLPRSSSAC